MEILRTSFPERQTRKSLYQMKFNQKLPDCEPLREMEEKLPESTVKVVRRKFSKIELIRQSSYTLN
jgi:hypothetical protein